jgi:hypothetical protein
VTGFDAAARGYDPAAVDLRVAALTAGLAAAERRLRELEAELTRLQAGVPRVHPKPRSRMVADQVEAILRPAHEDARRQVAQAHSVVGAERGYAEDRVAQLLARVQEEASAADGAARAAGHLLVAQARDVAEQIRAQSVVAAARIAQCAPEIVSAAQRDAMQVATWSLAGLTAVPQPSGPRPSPARPIAVPTRATTAHRADTPKRAGSISGPRTADTIFTITSTT